MHNASEIAFTLVAVKPLNSGSYSLKTNIQYTSSQTWVLFCMIYSPKGRHQFFLFERVKKCASLDLLNLEDILWAVFLILLTYTSCKHLHPDISI